MIKALLNSVKLLAMAMGGFILLLIAYGVVDNYLSQKEKENAALAHAAAQQQAESDRKMVSSALRDVYQYGMKADALYSDAVSTIGTLQFDVSVIMLGAAEMENTIDSLRKIRDIDGRKIHNEKARKNFIEGSGYLVAAYTAKVEYLLTAANALLVGGPLALVEQADFHQTRMSEYENALVRATAKFMQSKVHLEMDPELTEWR